MLSVAVYNATHPLSPRYFATTPEGRILPIIPLNQPNVNTPDLLAWASSAAVAAYSYDFVNYRRELQVASEYFTPEGWRKFIKALSDSNNLTAVKSKRLIVSAEPTGEAELVKQGLFNGAHVWRVKIPLRVTYQNSEQYSKQDVVVSMLVTRLPNINSRDGIGVAQFVVSAS